MLSLCFDFNLSGKLSAVKLTQNKDKRDESNNCSYSEVLTANIVYASPEAVLTTHRDFIRSESFQERLVCVAIDEAHIVSKWLVECLFKYLFYDKQFGA